jgi:hypothetical protein
MYNDKRNSTRKKAVISIKFFFSAAGGDFILYSKYKHIVHIRYIYIYHPVTELKEDQDKRWIDGIAEVCGEKKHIPQTVQHALLSLYIPRRFTTQVRR